jgi:2-haloacid dehalogenase
MCPGVGEMLLSGVFSLLLRPAEILMLDFRPFQVLTFDCYGTLIDWESGIFSALRPILAAHNRSVSDPDLLETYADLEAQAEAGTFLNYRDVLQSVVRGFGDRLGFQPTEAECRSLPESMSRWPPFPDTVAALKKLGSRFDLAVISNVDDDLFAASGPKLETSFKRVITAQQARCYKPCLEIFRMALEKLGVQPSHVLHVGQSVYHDMIPAEALGIATVWVNRFSPRPNAGAAKAASGKPDLEVPDLKTLAELAGAAA